MKLNVRNLPRVILGASVSAFMGLTGLLLVLGGSGLFLEGWWFPGLVGVGLAGILVSVVVLMTSTAALFETDWDADDVAGTPTLSDVSFNAALNDRSRRPLWTCTRCSVALPGLGIGSCIYCDSGANFFIVESDEDARMVLSSVGRAPVQWQHA